MQAASGYRRLSRGLLIVVVGPGVAWLLPLTALAQPESDPYAGAPVLETTETAPDAYGRFDRVRIVDTGGPYPLIRVHDRVQVDPVTQAEEVLSSSAVAADHILVRVRPGVSKDQLETLAASLGGRIRKKLFSQDLYLVATSSLGIDSVGDALAGWSEQRELIAHVEPDIVYYFTSDLLEPNDEFYVAGGYQWALYNDGTTVPVPPPIGDLDATADADMNAPPAWFLETGSRKVVVGVIDSGVDYTHPDLENNIWLNQEELKTDNGSYPQVLLDADTDATCGDNDGLVRAHELLCYIRQEAGIDWDFSQDGTESLRDLLYAPPLTVLNLGQALITNDNGMPGTGMSSREGGSVAGDCACFQGWYPVS